jgi:hypothetical protein
MQAKSQLALFGSVLFLIGFGLGMGLNGASHGILLSRNQQLIEDIARVYNIPVSPIRY